MNRVASQRHESHGQVDVSPRMIFQRVVGRCLTVSKQCDALSRQVWRQSEVRMLLATLEMKSSSVCCLRGC